SRPAVTVFCDIGDGEIVSILCADYCNNPADAWPIITENNISLIFDNPSSVMATSNCVGWHSDEEPPIHSSSNNPLRAAMIVFLMMKDAEKC
ncbi:phage protein NinX family protein, partial [Streptomyces sp. NPDC002666]